MSERTSPDLSELAYHIVSLWNFWSRSHAQKGEAIRAIKPMITFYFGADDSDSIARTVVKALESIEQICPFDQAGAEQTKVELITSFLKKQIVDLSSPRATKHWAAIFSTSNNADTLCS